METPVLFRIACVVLLSCPLNCETIWTDVELEPLEACSQRSKDILIFGLSRVVPPPEPEPPPLPPLPPLACIEGVKARLSTSISASSWLVEALILFSISPQFPSDPHPNDVQHLSCESLFYLLMLRGFKFRPFTRQPTCQRPHPLQTKDLGAPARLALVCLSFKEHRFRCYDGQVPGNPREPGQFALINSSHCIPVSHDALKSRFGS